MNIILNTNVLLVSIPKKSHQKSDSHFDEEREEMFCSLNDDYRNIAEDLSLSFEMTDFLPI